MSEFTELFQKIPFADKEKVMEKVSKGVDVILDNSVHICEPTEFMKTEMVKIMIERGMDTDITFDLPADKDMEEILLLLTAIRKFYMNMHESDIIMHIIDYYIKLAFHMYSGRNKHLIHIYNLHNTVSEKPEFGQCQCFKIDKLIEQFEEDIKLCTPIYPHVIKVTSMLHTILYNLRLLVDGPSIPTNDISQLSDMILKFCPIEPCPDISHIFALFDKFQFLCAKLDAKVIKQMEPYRKKLFLCQMKYNQMMTNVYLSDK